MIYLRPRHCSMDGASRDAWCRRGQCCSHGHWPDRKIGRVDDGTVRQDPTGESQAGSKGPAGEEVAGPAAATHERKTRGWCLVRMARASPVIRSPSCTGMVGSGGGARATAARSSAARLRAQLRRNTPRLRWDGRDRIPHPKRYGLGRPAPVRGGVLKNASVNGVVIRVSACIGIREWGQTRGVSLLAAPHPALRATFSPACGGEGITRRGRRGRWRGRRASRAG